MKEQALNIKMHGQDALLIQRPPFTAVVMSEFESPFSILLQ